MRIFRVYLFCALRLVIIKMAGVLYNAKMTEESRSTRAPKSNLRRCCNNLPNRIEDKRLPVGRASIVLLGQPIGPTLTKVWLPEKKKQIENSAMSEL